VPLPHDAVQAIKNNDPAEVRRLLGDVPFTEAQRRHVEGLLDAWEQSRPSR